MATAVELAQGNEFGRSAEGGDLSDTATRVYRVLLSSPNESWDIFATTGVNIGDSYSDGNKIPCVSLDARADGDSRLVRIVTARYSSSKLIDPNGGADPGLLEPTVRPAQFSTSTALYEEPVFDQFNPAKDRYDGITRLVPITTIRINQFQPFPATSFLTYAGYLNSETINIAGWTSLLPRTVMFRGVECNPHIEKFGSTTYRGFMNSFEFAYKLGQLVVVNGTGAPRHVGWDIAQIVEGYNCIAINPAGAGFSQEAFAVPLKRDDDTNKLKNPLQLADGAEVGKKVRAHVKVVSGGQDIGQATSAMPIALNLDGTPRSFEADPIITRLKIQPEANLTSLLGLRLQ
jgi:hypothetical protein